MSKKVHSIVVENYHKILFFAASGYRELYQASKNLCFQELINSFFYKSRDFNSIFEILISCPADEKLISKFQGTWANRESMYETVIYAHMKTFRFTGTPALYIECDIRMCHGACPVNY